MKAWVNHFALNIGAMLACIWFAVIPPQWTGHNAMDLQELRKGTPWKAFWWGLTS